MHAVYAGGVVFTGDPADAPKTGVLALVVGRKQVLFNFEFYVLRKDFNEWGGCNCRTIAQEYERDGHTVFSGEWVSNAEFQEALSKARELSHSY